MSNKESRRNNFPDETSDSGKVSNDGATEETMIHHTPDEVLNPDEGNTVSVTVKEQTMKHMGENNFALKMPKNPDTLTLDGKVELDFSELNLDDITKIIIKTKKRIYWFARTNMA